jgi:hypothetical protein
VRPQGQTQARFFPPPVAEARRLKNWLSFPERFSALDPCVGDGVAFTHLLHGFKPPIRVFQEDQFQPLECCYSSSPNCDWRNVQDC